MKQFQPRYETYEVVNAHTGKVVSSHPTRAAAESAKSATDDHALRVRGGKSKGLAS